MLSIPLEKARDLDGPRYRDSPHFSQDKVALLDFCVQIGQDATRVSKDLWVPLHEHWSEPHILDAAFFITTKCSPPDKRVPVCTTFVFGWMDESLTGGDARRPSG